MTDHVITARKGETWLVGVIRSCSLPGRYIQRLDRPGTEVNVTIIATIAAGLRAPSPS